MPRTWLSPKGLVSIAFIIAVPLREMVINDLLKLLFMVIVHLLDVSCVYA